MKIMDNLNHPAPTILLIEDQPRLLRSMSFLMEVAGWQTASAETIQAATAVLRQQMVDVIVCNVDLADSDAYTFLRRVRKDARFGHIPFIVTSASYELHDLMYALDLGASDYLPKPFDTYDLLDAVHNALMGQSQLRIAS
jgi:CheY-like chemotaxis protein